MKAQPLKIDLNDGETKIVSGIPLDETISGFRFFTHIEQNGSGVSISEWRTGVHCCTSATRKTVIEKFKKIYADYGDKAFSDKVRKGHAEFPEINPIPVKINHI